MGRRRGSSDPLWQGVCGQMEELDCGDFMDLMDECEAHQVLNAPAEAQEGAAAAAASNNTLHLANIKPVFKKEVDPHCFSSAQQRSALRRFKGWTHWCCTTCCHVKSVNHSSGRLRRLAFHSGTGRMRIPAQISATRTPSR